ncbi:hypothetical protein B484DRAFT_404888 [Ochromonadaceae sp. CCMP2298]|nr:hypothetical protein B484DRAFT_404888 [Ochromonadaceae sp. CCMP2298]
MERTIPYFLNEIRPDSIDRGQNVLIASSDLEIPTGLPLVYDIRLRKIRLLQESPGQTGAELLKKYNFGELVEYQYSEQYYVHFKHFKRCQDRWVDEEFVAKKGDEEKIESLEERGMQRVVMAPRKKK